MPGEVVLQRDKSLFFAFLWKEKNRSSLLPSFFFSKDESPVTTTKVQPWFLMPWPHVKVPRDGHSFPRWEKPQSSWLKGKNTHVHVIFIQILFSFRVPTLNVKIKWNHLYSLLSFKCNQPNFKRKHTYESWIKIKLNFLKIYIHKTMTSL